MLLEAVAAALLILGSFLILKTLAQVDAGDGSAGSGRARPPRRDSHPLFQHRRAA